MGVVTANMTLNRVEQKSRTCKANHRQCAKTLTMNTLLHYMLNM